MVAGIPRCCIRLQRSNARSTKSPEPKTGSSDASARGSGRLMCEKSQTFRAHSLFNDLGYAPSFYRSTIRGAASRIYPTPIGRPQAFLTSDGIADQAD